MNYMTLRTYPRQAFIFLQVAKDAFFMSYKMNKQGPDSMVKGHLLNLSYGDIIF